MKEENKETPQTAAPAETLFSKALLCKEQTKEIINRPPPMQSLDQMKAFLTFAEAEQSQCLNLIEKLKEEAAKNDQPQVLVTALIKTQERILVEKKQIKSFNAETLNKEDATNLGYMQVGIGLVRQQEEIAWVEYRQYLENQKLGVSDGFSWSFVFWIMVIGVIMALVKRNQKKDEK